MREAHGVERWLGSAMLIECEKQCNGSEELNFLRETMETGREAIKGGRRKKRCEQ